MMWQQVVCTSGPAKDIQETEGLFRHRSTGSISRYTRCFNESLVREKEQSAESVWRSGSSVAAAFGAGIGALMQEWAFVVGYDPFMNGRI